MLELLAADLGIADLANEIEHAVQRRIEAAGHIARDEHYRQEIFVVDGLLPLALTDVDNLQEGDEIAVMAGHPKHEQTVEIRFIGDRQLKTHGHRVFPEPVTYVGDIFTVQCGLQGLRDARLRNAQQCRLVSIDRNDKTRR